jgi:hypothetical protein
VNVIHSHIELSSEAHRITGASQRGDSNKRDHDAAWQLLRSGAVTVIALDDADLPELQSLMKRYRDRPMDLEIVSMADRPPFTAP